MRAYLIFVAALRQRERNVLGRCNSIDHFGRIADHTRHIAEETHETHAIQAARGGERLRVRAPGRFRANAR